LLRLKRPGFAEREVSLDLAIDTMIRESLTKLPDVAAPISPVVPPQKVTPASAGATKPPLPTAKPVAASLIKADKAAGAPVVKPSKPAAMKAGSVPPPPNKPTSPDVEELPPLEK
jgi:hypothetical protein